jgi:glycosyltransferase involved in cell wall biosynthesis
VSDAARAPGLSVVLIVRNEAARLRQCLQSVAWADEIVVLDSGSTDETVAIARQFTDRVASAEWSGFGPLKNRALDLATRDWVLSLDADEEVSPELKEEILRAMRSPNGFDGYLIPRLSYYCGRFMKHSGWWPDPVARLVKRGRGRFTDDPVHERLVIDGRTGRLASPLIHRSYDDFEQVLEKLDRYSTIAAQRMLEQGKRAGLTTAIVHGCWSFLRTYFLQLGILDGRQGFMLAVTNAEHSYYRYLKLWRLLEKRKAT